VLLGKKKVAIKRAVRKNQDVPDAMNAEAGLFERLKGLRKRIADHAGVPPFVIFSDATLSDMCRKMPHDTAEFLQVSGVGSYKAEKYGQDFISEILQYGTEHSMGTDEEEPVRKAIKKKSMDKSDTAELTYGLYKKGLNIDDIAFIRALAASTIEEHLLLCLKNGMEVDFKRIYPEEYEPQIIKAVKTHGTKNLETIKKSLPEEIPYGAIRFVICRGIE